MSATLQEIQNAVNSEIMRDYPNNLTRDLQNLVVLGLTEEAGEVAGLRKRNLRNNARDVGRGGREEYIDELGDVLWYLAACCALFSTDLDEIWQMNRQKLEERYGRTECEGQCKLPESLYPG